MPTITPVASATSSPEVRTSQGTISRDEALPALEKKSSVSM